MMYTTYTVKRRASRHTRRLWRLRQPRPGDVRSCWRAAAILMRSVTSTTLLLPLLHIVSVSAFLPSCSRPIATTTIKPAPSPAASSSTRLRMVEIFPDVNGMTVPELREELDSYGVPSRAFLEGKDLRRAVKKARDAGMKTIDRDNNEMAQDAIPPNREMWNGQSRGKTHASSQSSSGGSSSRTSTIDGEYAKVNDDASSSSRRSSTSSKSSSDTSASARDKKYQDALAKAKDMKTGDLKKELQSMGISTRSFFEKSEFVQAYARAVADGVEKNNSSSGGRRNVDAPRDSSYRDVVMQKMNAQDARFLQGGRVIDIFLTK